MVASGRYVEIATERDEPICGGTVDYLDRVISAGFAALGESPPDRVFVRYEWLSTPETAIVGGSARRQGDGILIRSDVQLVDEHELTHAVHLQAWPSSNKFLHEGLAVLFDPKRIFYDYDSWPENVALDDVIGPGPLTPEGYYLAWFLVSQLVRDHGFDGLREFWHALPSGSTPAQVRDVYAGLFGRPMDALIEPYVEELTPGHPYEVDREPCNFALCPATPTPWQGLLWSVPGPTDCEDDEFAIGPDQRKYAGEYGEIWRDYTVDTVNTSEIGSGRKSFALDPRIAGTITPCTWNCDFGVSMTLEPGLVAEDTQLPGYGLTRIEVRTSLADVPTTNPGIFTMEDLPP